MKAIIYYRKSTDRDDKQANSLEHQIENCRKIANSHSYEIFKEIGESKSAKTEGMRPGFNELIEICKTGKIDYIIIDEPKRLSRNNIDTSRIIDLLDKEQIKGILGTSRKYIANNSRDKFLLQLDLSLSKMDNEDRSKDVKEKMVTCINNTGRFLGKAPFGYRNVTIKKGHKQIILDKKEAKVVREIYSLRLENKAYSTIAIILREKYGKTINLCYQANRIHKLVTKKFYYGIFTWNGKEILGNHKAIITKETYDKAHSIGKGVHQKIISLQQSDREHRKYYLKGLVKDVSGIKLTSYVKKGIIYYGNQYRSIEKVSIHENLLFEKIGDFIKKSESDNKVLKSIEKDIIFNLLRQNKLERGNDFLSLDTKIKKLKKKQSKLLDLKLDEVINEEVYLSKNNLIENEIKDFLEQIEAIENDDFEVKTQVMLELAGSFYQSYFRANKEGKTYIIKNLMLELFVSNKKELRIEDSPLLQSSKILNFSYGTPNDFNIRTFKKYLSMIDLEELKEFHKFIKKIISQ